MSLAESIIPAADLSEQISTAGMEASGTGNMKLALNGALTIGTLDGANIEIRERVGADNFVPLRPDRRRRPRRGARRASTWRRRSPQSPPLARVLDAIASGMFSPDDPARFSGLVERLRRNDYFMVCADFASYVDAQRARRLRYGATPMRGGAPRIANTANVGFFSSDRAIREYAGEVWGLPKGRG